MSTAVQFLLHSSLRGGVLILAVLLLRFLLHRIPKRFTCFLWTAVWLRLALPFAVRSRFSLLPSWLSMSRSPTAVPEQTATITKPVAVSPGTAASASAAAHMDWVLLIWIAGLTLLLIFALARYLLLKRRVREAIPLRDKIWLCDWVETPFLLGLVRPRIYLPSGVEEADIPWISAHEEAHLRHGDPWRKLGAFLLTAVYWFQPLVWVAFFLYRRDLELACDERAGRDFDMEARSSYVRALMRASMLGRSVWAAPMGFGSAPVKRRVEAILHPRRCGRGKLVIAALFCVVILFTLSLEPVRAAQALPGGSEQTAETVTETAEKQQVYLTRVEDYQFGSGSNIYILRCGDKLYQVLGDDMCYAGHIYQKGEQIPDPLEQQPQDPPWWAQNGDVIPADGYVYLVWEEGKAPMYAINDKVPPGVEKHYWTEGEEP